MGANLQGMTDMFTTIGIAMIIVLVAMAIDLAGGL